MRGGAALEAAGAALDAAGGADATGGAADSTAAALAASEARSMNPPMVPDDNPASTARACKGDGASAHAAAVINSATPATPIPMSA